MDPKPIRLKQTDPLPPALTKRIRATVIAWAMRQHPHPIQPLRGTLKRLGIELAVMFVIICLLQLLPIDARRWVNDQCAGFLIGLGTTTFFKRFIWRREVAGR